VKNVGQEHLTEAVPFRPEFVGQRGLRSCSARAAASTRSTSGWTGWACPLRARRKPEILQEVKAKSLEKKGLLGEGELRTIAEHVLGSVPA
jgi:hypothetical protein